jgi:hypothetical protein
VPQNVRVTYRVTSLSGNPATVTVLYAESDTQTRELTIALPWTLELNAVSGTTMLVVVTNETENTLVGCEILVNGAVLNSERQQAGEEDVVCVIDIE